MSRKGGGLEISNRWVEDEEAESEKEEDNIIDNDDDDEEEESREEDWPSPDAVLSRSFSTASRQMSEAGTRSRSGTATRVTVYESGAVSVASEDLITRITPKKNRSFSFEQVPHSHYHPSPRGDTSSIQSRRKQNTLDSPSTRRSESKGLHLFEDQVGERENALARMNRVDLWMEDEREADYYDKEGFPELEGVQKNWRSALAVSSLHRAFSRSVAENRALKTALHASEKRCAELLGMDETQRSTRESPVPLEPEERKEFEIIKEKALELEKENEQLRQELAKESAEKIELMQWKSEWLAKERQNMQVLRSTLDDANEEKENLNVALESMRSALLKKDTALEKSKKASSRLLFRSFQRMQLKAIHRAWRKLAEEFLAHKHHKEQLQTQKLQQERKDRLVRRSIARLESKTVAKCFTFWADKTAEERRKRLRTGQLLSRIQKQAQSKAWTSWCGFHSRRKLLRRTLIGISARITSKLTAAGFFTWQRHIRAANEVRLTQDIENLRNANQEAAEKENTLRSKHKERMALLAAKSAAKWQGSFVALTFLSWRAYVVRVNDSRLLDCFQRWKLRAKTKARLRKVADRFLSKQKSKVLANTLSSWRTAVKELRENRVKVGRFVARFLSSKMVFCFDAWKEYTREQLSIKRKARRIFGVVQGNLLSSTFSRWRQFLNDEKLARSQESEAQERENALLNKFLLRWRNQRMSQVFQSWTDFVARRTWLRGLLSRLHKKASQSHAMCGFSTWRRATTLAVRQSLEDNLRTKSQAVDELAETLQRVNHELNILRERFGVQLEEATQDKDRDREAHAARVIKLWQNRRLGKFFFTFKMNAQELRSNRLLMEKITKRWKNNSMLHCLTSWREFVENRKFLRRMLRTMTETRAEKLVHTAFRTWHSNAHASVKLLLHEEKMKNASLADRLQALESNHVELSLRFETELNKLYTQRDRIVSRLAWALIHTSRKELLRQVFQAWGGYSSSKGREKRLLAKFSAKLRNQGLQRAFYAWEDNVSTLKRNRAIVEKAAMQMRHMKLSAAFRGWFAIVKERVAIRAKATLIFGQKDKLVVFKCFSAWKTFTRECIEKKDRARRVFAELIQDTLRRTFTDWKMYVQDIVQERQESMEHEQIVQRVLARMCNKTLSHAFQSWCTHVSENKLRRERVTRFMLRWKHRTLSQSFDTWTDYARDRQRLRVILHQGMARMQMKQVYAAFRHWQWYLRQAHVDSLSQAKDRIAFLEAKLGEIEWDQQAAQTKFGEDFSKLISHRNRIRDRYADRVLANLQNQTVYKALHGWKAYVRAKKSRRHRLTMFLLRCKNVRAARCFSAWSAAVKLYQRRRALLTRILSHMHAKGLAKAWRTWRTALDTATRKQRGVSLLHRSLRRMNLRALSKAWESLRGLEWAAEVAQAEQRALYLDESRQRLALTAEKLREMCLRKAIMTWTRPLLTRTFLEWSANCAMLKDQRVKMELVTKHMQHRLEARAYRSWAAFVRKRRQQKMYLRSLVARWKLHALALGFRSWFKATSMQLVVELRDARNESIVVACLQKSRLGTLYRMLYRWKGVRTKSGEKSRALRTIALYIKRMRASSLIPALNQWKLVTLIRSSEAMRFIDKNGVVETIRHALLSMLSHILMFRPALIENGFVSGVQPSDSTSQVSGKSGVYGPSPRHGSVPLRSAAASMAFAEPKDWGILDVNISRCADLLFQTDSIRVMEVLGDSLNQYSETGERVHEFSLQGDGLTAMVARSGQTIALHHARRDPRYRAELDEPFHSRDGSLRKSGRIVLSTSLQPNALMHQRHSLDSRLSRSSMGETSRYRDKVVAFICVPILDQHDRVAGVIQATRGFASEEEYDYSYLEMCNVVLSAVCEASSSLLAWKQAAHVLSVELEEVSTERDHMKEDNMALEESKKTYEDYISQLKTKTRKTDRSIGNELRLAYQKINKLEGRTKTAKEVEEQVKQLIHQFDRAVEQSSPPSSPRRARAPSGYSQVSDHVGGGFSTFDEEDRFSFRTLPSERSTSFATPFMEPSSSFAYADRSSPLFPPAEELRHLEREQHDFSARLGSTRARLNRWNDYE